MRCKNIKYVMQKYEIRHEITLFCSSSVKTDPIWLFHEEPNSEAKGRFFCIRNYSYSNQHNDEISSQRREIFEHFLGFQANLRLRFGFPLSPMSRQTVDLLHFVYLFP